MVLPAVLRDAARYHLQHRTDRLEARRRSGHVWFNRDPLRGSLARYVEGSFSGLSPLVQAVLLAVRHQCHLPWLAWFASCGRHLCLHGSVGYALLLRILHRHHAGSWPD
ncbi:hypothetical protein D3C81_1680470 [compost metagenome]